MIEGNKPGKELRASRLLPELIGESAGITNLRAQVAYLLGRQGHGRRLPTLLILGETGTGKGLLARAIHQASMRAARPFVDIDCAAIPETLLEAELFGVERGAFTDARQTRPGLFQTARGGTLLLDEVGLLPRSLQGKLLKVVEERGVRRLGSVHTEVVDLWVLAATNVDLGAAVRDGSFREDLYHRLAAVTFIMPPLRARNGDTLILAEHFLARACAEYRLPPKVLAPEARAAMLAYPWPGNVRQLANVLERVVLLSGEDTMISADLLALPAAPAARLVPSAHAEPGHHRSLVEGFERERLLEALRRARGNVTAAAAHLGLPRNTLRYRMAKLRIRAEDFGETPVRPSKPLAKMSAGPAASAKDRDTISATPKETKVKVHRVLVVEDEQAVRDYLVDFLTELGHHVESAGSGSEALSLLDERSYALILTDLRMPDTDGEGLYQKIAQTWPHLASRVVFVTGHEPSPALAMFFGARDVPIIRKPFMRDELELVLDRKLSREP
jgi:two-component system, NtrC family, response regulator AtoC